MTHLPDDVPAGVSPELVEFFSDQTHRAVAKAVKQQARRSLVGFLVLAAGLGFALHQNAETQSDSSQHATEARQAVVRSGRAVSVDGCNRDFRTIKTLRGVLQRGKAFQEAAFERGDITPAQRDRASAYYDEQLAALALPDCRAALNVVTDNPDAPVNIPIPLHPAEGSG